LQARVRPQLANTIRLGWLRAKPTLTGDGFWYSKNQNGEEGIFQGNYEASCAVTMANGIWRIYDITRKSRIKKVRHFILPTITYYYRPEPTDETEDLYNFCDRLRPHQDLIKVALENSVEGKKANGKRFEFLNLELFSYYDRLGEEHKWQNIAADLRANSLRNISLRTLAIYNPHIEKLESLDTDLYFNKKKWDLSLGTRFYEPGGEEDVFDAIGSLKASPSKNWTIELEARYDLNREDFKVRRISLLRDLHCLQAQVFFQSETDEEGEEESKIFFALKVKGVGAALKTPSFRR